MITTQSNIRHLIFIIILCLLLFSGCSEQTEISVIPVEISVDGQVINDSIEIGSTIQTVLTKNKIVLNPLDKVDPPVFSVITEQVSIEIIRVEETFETEEIVIPFEQQSVRNESLPERQTILIQPGVNGLQEITYRLLYENGQLYSRTEVRKVDIVTPKAEIIMIGVQTPFSSIQIEGKIVYLSSGNAWLIENETSNRKPLITNGKLDGRILKLSPDLRWLLFTQISEEENNINELWVLDLENEELSPTYLKFNNIIHFADWLPGNARSLLISTVEPREVAPGWQANNNLIQLTLGASGNVVKSEEIIESNSGGIYGWWGTNFQISSSGDSIAFSRPDTVGLVDLSGEELIILTNIIPYQTKSDWAWVSQTTLSDDNRFIYWVDHQEDPSIQNQELSPIFNLNAYDIELNQKLATVENVGMFANPAIISTSTPEEEYKIIYLQAIFPESSDSSRYRLMAIDRDGSNSRKIFPIEEMQGLEPQNIITTSCNENSTCQIGFIYQGNLWVINEINNFTAHQITGDGLITQIEWK
jgi:hypothetical protein